MEYRVVNIGALAAHPLRGEREPVRLGHATTTVVTADDATILIDPSLPAEVLAPRLQERCGFGPEAVTHVFLTSFRPDLRRGIHLFDHADWLISERERETVGASLIQDYQQTGADDVGSSADDESTQLLRDEIAILKRCKAAPDQIAAGVDLFPLPGRTFGNCGILLAHPRLTILICGDAIPTLEHVEQGKVLPDCVDVALAQESFIEAIEIADLLIPGRDNIIVNPTRKPF